MTAPIKDTAPQPDSPASDAQACCASSSVRVVGLDDVPPNVRRGGDLRVTLSPTTVGSTSGFMGVALLAPGDAITEHYHPYSEEFVHLVQGELEVDLDGVTHQLRAEQSLMIPREMRHRFRNVSRTEARMVFQLAPLAPRPELGHVDTESPAAPTEPHPGIGGRDVKHRVVVTGVGVVAPGGVGVPAFWDLLTSGRTATRGITFFDPAPFRSRIAAECDFDAAASGVSAERARRADRYVQFALAAAAEAVRDSGLDLDVEDPWRIGVSLGTAVGGTTRLEQDYVGVAVRPDGVRWDVDHRAAAPFLHRAFTPAALSSEVAEEFGARGPVQTVSTGCTSGLDAVGYAAHAIEEGRADIYLAGASDSPISPITVACFDAIKATSTRNDDPAHASRPFDAHRDGFVLGEGCAVLVLEELDHALRRGVPIYAEIGGFATRGNAYHMTGLTREGLEMAESISHALGDARVDATDVDYVNAHGSGTQQNDRHETAAVKLALGEHARRTPMSSIKSMVGHSLGAIGAIELAACALAMAHGVVPPTANYETPDPECDLDYVPGTAREASLETVLSVGSGFGGFQSAVVLDRRSVDGPIRTGGCAVMDTNRQAVVTGLGVVAPNGIGTDSFWKATREGTAHLTRITREGCDHLPLAVAGLVDDFDPVGTVEDKFLVQTDRFTHFALHAADQALRDAGIPDLPEYAIGVATASSSGGGEFGQRELQNLWGTGPDFVGPYQSIAWFYAASTGQISIRGGFKGPCAVLADDEAGGLDAIAHAARSIGRGADAMVVGAAEAPIAPYSMVCQLGYDELSRAVDPGRAYLPFDAAACGFAPAEGGAVLVLEERGAAERRGAVIRATVAGHGATFTGTDDWAASRQGLARAIGQALAEAGVGPDEIDVVFADALAVPAADRAEVLALGDALGAHAADVPVTAPKAGIGRAYCGGPVLDVAAAVLAMEHGVIPPTPGVFATEYDIDLVTGRARAARVRTALVLSRGLMGCNAALVLRGHD